MRLIFYLIIISQLLNFLGAFAEKGKDDSSESNSFNWEKVEENKSKKFKKIIWKSYNNDEFYFDNNKSIKDLGLKYISVEESTSDFFRQFIDHDLI